MEFIMRMKFWIALGLLVLVSGVVLGVWFVPARGKSSSLMEDWQRKAGEVHTLAQQQRAPNQEAISQARGLKDDYERDLQQVMQKLQERDQLLERYMPDPADNSEKAVEPGKWKGIYDEQMTALEEDIRKSFAVASQGLVVRTHYGDDWPPVEEMRREAKRYWMQRYLLQALAEANDERMAVPVLSSFTFLERPERLLHPSHGELFRPWAFELVIATEFQDLPLVLEKLLQCEVGVSITSVQMDRRSEGIGTSAAQLAQSRAAAREREQPTAGIRTAAPVRTAGPPPGVATGRMAGRGAIGGRPTMAAAAGREAGRAAGAAAAAAGRAQARVGVSRSGPTGGGRGRSRGPTGVRRPSVGPRRPRGAAAEESASIESEKLLTVTIRGYVEDYVPPEEEEEKEE